MKTIFLLIKRDTPKLLSLLSVTTKLLFFMRKVVKPRFHHFFDLIEFSGFMLTAIGKTDAACCLTPFSTEISP